MLSYRGGKREPLFGPNSATPEPQLASEKTTVGNHKTMPRAQAWTRRHYLLALCLSWVILIWYGERTYPYRAISQCKWSGEFSRANRVALVADPQIIDENTYPERPSWLLRPTQFITDLYLRRNWLYINQVLDPDSNVFLGDLFDGGREWNDTQWRAEFERYNRIFTKPPYKRTVMSLPGNHDIGFGDDIVPRALGRFQAFFGETSSTIEVGNHTLVLLDTISMTNRLNESIWKPPLEFMEKLGHEEQVKPRILLTHVPLYRPKDHTCGKLREHGDKGLPNAKGIQYETLLRPEMSQRILSEIKPMAVFSGDDHDACHVQHSYLLNEKTQQADEFTVKSVSMAMGIQHPGIQLLTLNAEPNANLHDPDGNMHTSICLMPSPWYALMLYGLMGVVSLVSILLMCLKLKVPDSYLPLHKESSMKPRGIKLMVAKQVVMVALVPCVVYFYLAWSIYRD